MDRKQPTPAPVAARTAPRKTSAPRSATRQPLERLEVRQMLSSATALSVDFVPTGVAPASGYHADSGKKYAVRPSGQTYGWVADGQTHARDRNVHGDQRLDTLIHFGGGKANSAWQALVPNGTYKVEVTAGDPSYVDSKYHITAEGQTVVNGTPTWGTNFITQSATVNVADGKLTIASGSGAVNNKISSVKFSRVSTTQGGNTAAGLGAISWLSKGWTSKTEAQVHWDSAANTHKYELQRSADNGGSWTTVAQTSKTDTNHTDGDLSADTDYWYRVRPTDAQGNGGAWSTTLKVKTQPNAGTSTGGNTSGPTGPALTGGLSYDVGVNANTGSAGPNGYVSEMQDLGIKHVRIWYTVTSYDTRSVNNWYLERAEQFKQLGFKVTLAVQNKYKSSYENTKGFFQVLANSDRMRNAVDFWQINNEINHGPWWNGTIAEYVQTNLKPAWEVLKPKGETIVGSALTGDPADTLVARNAGYLNYVDFAAYHPYGSSGADVANRAKIAAQNFAGKPLMFTEWAVLGGSNEWQAQQQTIAAAALKQYGALSFYFPLVVYGGNYGKGGLMHNASSRNSVMYDAFENWD